MLLGLKKQSLKSSRTCYHVKIRTISDPKLVPIFFFFNIFLVNLVFFTQ